MPNKLTAVHDMTEEESIGSLTRQFVLTDPTMQHRVMMSPNLAAGATSTAWYRGRLCGIHDAFLTLKDKYPQAAKQLREAFGMHEDGSIHA